MMILKNAYVDSDKSLVKTKVGKLYGLYNIVSKEQIVPNIYLHIFDFEGDIAIVITKDVMYKSITKDGTEAEISSELKEEYEHLLLKSDPCNCDGEGVCKLCKNTGQVENSFGLDYNFRFFHGFNY